MPYSSDEILLFLEQHGIQATTFSHLPVHTVEDSRQLRGDIPGTHTKNLFLRDNKKTFYLVTMDEATKFDLKELRAKIGAKGGLSFGAPEMLMELLGITPGSVSLLALINDIEHKVTMVLDESLLRSDFVNCHPLSNRHTTSLSPESVVSFLSMIGHEPLRISLDDGS